MKITAGHAREGDVVLDGHAKEWKRGSEFYLWYTFDGLVTHEGPWEAKYGPQGPLDLLVRDGKPVR